MKNETGSSSKIQTKTVKFTVKRIRTKFSPLAGSLGNSKESKHKERKSPQVSVIFKTPGMIDINGPLASININSIYDSVRKRITYLAETRKDLSHAIQSYMNHSFQSKSKPSRSHIDLAFAYKIQICKAAEDVLGDKSYLALCGDLIINEIRSSKQVKNSMLLESMIYHEMFLKGLSTTQNRKPKKLWKWVHKTARSLQNCQPCSWTAKYNEMGGQFYSYLAFTLPYGQIKNNRHTFQCYSRARKDYIEHDNGTTGSYSWVYCLFQMQNALLQMPLRRHLEFVVSGKGGQTLLQDEKCVSLNGVEKARNLMKKAKLEFGDCDSSKYLQSFMYNWMLATTYVELRHAQVLKSQKNYSEALRHSNIASDVCRAFLKESEAEKHKFYMDYLRIWIEQHVLSYLNHFEQNLRLNCCDKFLILSKHVFGGTTPPRRLLQLLEDVSGCSESPESDV